MFIKGIPGEYKAGDLLKLVNRYFKPAWSELPVKGARISGSKILEIVDTGSELRECHGLVYIKPPRMVHSTIGRLNATTIKRRRLHAHPYVRRYTGRDRRREQLDKTVAFPGERRRKDRRRENLVSRIADSADSLLF
ncbi:MAG: hypothetical protein KZQ76_15480 [Candidatus Thiodiazotropha sp. (ex Epidulcina cf. delphinae)]|nr:hypothetical protein [Candidatus Thiodiazotropha sp. (ex Epidulcina cf. delphinae)]